MTINPIYADVIIHTYYNIMGRSIIIIIIIIIIIESEVTEKFFYLFF